MTVEKTNLLQFKFKKPIFFRIRGTIIVKIWWQIIFIIFYSITIVCFHLYVPQMKMDFPQTLIPILGIVIGLLLVFRTNTAYDRYWEGRRIWSKMTVSIRTLSRCIWIGVQESNASKSKDIVEKISAINLLVAFANATKNYLRHDYSYESEDIKDLVNHIQHFSTPSSNQPLEMQEEIAKVGQELEDKSGNRSGKPMAIVTPVKSLSNKNGIEPIKTLKNQNVKILTPHDSVTPTNIPLELSYYIASYINSVRGRALADSFTIAEMNNSLNALVECLTGFERILRTPIPLAYSVHLHHSIWIYILSLPFQLVAQLCWWTIPAVTLASFALLGLLGIGWEIENPFGYDDNDLPLDDFCKVIEKEIQVIVAHAMMPIDSWVMSTRNRPFSKLSTLSALELSSLSPEELRTILRKGIPTGRGIFEENLVGDRDFFHIRLGNLQFAKYPHLQKFTSTPGKF